MSASPFWALRSAVFRQRQLLRIRQFHAGKPLLDNAAKEASDKALGSAQKALGSAQKGAEKAFEGAKKAGQQLEGLWSKYREPIMNNLEGVRKASGPFVERAGNAFGNAAKRAGPVGERLNASRGPFLYYFSVARELAKQVYVAERLQPPVHISQWTTAYSSLFSRAKDPQYWRGLLSSGEWARVAVYGVEAYAIFHIGEIIGRRSIVGYKLD